MRYLGIAALIVLGCTVGARPAAAAPLTITCGALVSTTVKTDVDSTVAGGSIFNSLIGAFAVVTVPAGTTRCIKAVFAPGETTCGTPNGCLVRAVAGSTALYPAPIVANAQHVRSYHEWVRRLGPGIYPVQIQIQPAGGIFTARNWVLEVQVFQ